MSRAVAALQIHTHDQDATAQFFRTVFGWDFRPFDPMPWTQRATAGATTLALAPVHDMNGPGEVTLGVWSDDLATDLRLVVAGGGHVLVEPSDGPGGARFAVAAAPGGTKVLFYDAPGDTDQQPGSAE